MAIRHIEAVVACDNCNTVFSMDIDPAYIPPGRWSMYDVAVDSIRGGQVGIIGPPGIPSVQGGMHLCSLCTKTVDLAYPEDHYPTEPEVKTALAEERLKRKLSDGTLQPPIDNDHVAPGATPFTDDEIRLAR